MRHDLDLLITCVERKVFKERMSTLGFFKVGVIS